MRHWCSFRYDTSSGIFTVPQGGEGLYYFSTYLLLENGESGCFDIRVNGVVLCSTCGDEDANTGDDNSQATCSGITHLQEGGCDPNVNVNLWNSADSMIFSFVCSSCNVVKILPQQFSQNEGVLKWKSCFYSSDDEVTVVYASGTDTIPLAGLYFNGLRLWANKNEDGLERRKKKTRKPDNGTDHLWIKAYGKLFKVSFRIKNKFMKAENILGLFQAHVMGIFWTQNIFGSCSMCKFLSIVSHLALFIAVVHGLAW